MLSTERRFLFVHIPKTAGNAIQDALRAFADDEIVCLSPHQDGVERFELRSRRYRTVKHSTLNDCKREYGAEMLDGLYRFTCVRSPWNRCMSHYFSPHRGAVRWNKAEFLGFIETQVQPIAHYLSLGAPRQSAADAVRNVHRVLRFEHLEADFALLCQTLGLPTLTLARRNASPAEHHTSHYDAETQAAVAKRFGDEIACFGYEPPPTV